MGNFLEEEIDHNNPFEEEIDHTINSTSHSDLLSFDCIISLDIKGTSFY